ncbi:MAG TPA: phosphoribosylanthranilate isomerase [Pyrinomonadaceae bacterium]
MTLVKICGITNLEDALAAVDAGADALGFNFYPRSPRYISPPDAREIIDQLPPSILKVGVFVNEELESLLRIAGEANLTALQLHGDESPEYCEQLRGKYVIKAFGAGIKFDWSAVDRYDVDAIMLDTKDDLLRGGTGRVFDWSIAHRAGQSAKSRAKLFLAGGLSPENVAAAIATVRPDAIDACSSLEQTPGKKDHERVRAFINAVRGITP